VMLTFTQNEYKLTITKTGSGTVTKKPDKATFALGEVVQLTAKPAAGWSFSAWGGDKSGSTNPTQVNINGNMTVTATFTQNDYTLTVTSVGSGTVTKTPDKATYHYGDVVQLTAIPETDWSFTSWSGDLSGSENPTSLTVNGTKVLAATFMMNSIFEVISINATPGEVDTATPVTVTVTVKNVGGQSGDFDAELMVNGSPESSRIVTVAAGEQTVIEFPVLKNIIGSYTATVEDKSASWSVKAPLKPASFEVTELQIDPADAYVGSSVKITVNVRNVGEAKGDYTAELIINGTVEKMQNQTVSINGGEQATLIWNIVKMDLRQYSVEVTPLTGSFRVVELKPASIQLKNLQLSKTEAAPNEQVTVSVTAENTGDVAGSVDVVVKLDSVEKATYHLTLNGGQSEVKTFTLSSPDEGLHKIFVNSESLDLTVKSPQQSTANWITAGFIIIVILGVAAILGVSALSILRKRLTASSF